MTDKQELNSAGIPGQITLNKIISQIPGMIFQLLRKPDGAYSLPYASDAINELFGCSPQDVRNDFSPITKVIIGEDKEKFRTSIEESARTLLTWQCEYRVQRPGQMIHWLLARAIPEQQSDGSILWHGYNIDITERRQTGQQLETQCALLTAIMNSPSDITIFSLDKNYCYTAFNEKHREEMKKAWDADIMVGRNMLDCIRDPELREKTKQSIDHALQGQTVTDISHRTEPDTYYELIWGPVVQNGKIVGANAFIRDVTERKRLEAELEKNNRALRLLSATNQALIHATAELALMNEICQIVIKSGYRSAWVGMKEEDEGKSVRPVAQEGFAPEYLKEAQITWADNERGRGPTGTAIRTGKPAICRNMLTDPNFAPWREQAKKNNYQSSIALPLLLGEKIFGALNIYAAEPDAFNEQEVKYLNELAADLAFGLDYLRGQEQRKLAAEKIRQSEAKFSAAFKASPDLMAITRASDGLMLELNDGYTQLLGYTREESIGQTTTKVSIWANPADRDKFVANLKKDGQVIDFETVLRRKDGTLVTVLDSARTFELQGETYILSIAHDISKRKLAEKEHLYHLRFMESLDKVNRAIQGTSDLNQMMHDVLEVVLSIFDCDRAWLFYPCDPDATMFRVPMEITKPEYPGAKALNTDVPLPPDMAQNLREALGSVDPVTFTAGTEKPINKVSAEQFGVKSMMMIALYPKSGKPWVFGLHQCSSPRLWTDEEKNLFKEISNRLSDGLNSVLFSNELRESESRFRLLYESMNEGMAVHQIINDQSGHPIDYLIQDVNPAFERLTGIKKAQAVGQKATKLYAQEKAPYLDIYTRVVVTGKPEMFDTDYEAMNKSFSISAFALGEGRFATVFFDITERKKTAEEISKKVSELERFNKITMGREDRIIELKQEIKRLKEKYGEQ